MTLVLKGKKVIKWLEKHSLSRRDYVLRSQWKVGANIIKRIRSKRVHLPWYLLVGDRCGKSTVLASSGLPRFYGEDDDMVVGPTRTLRWWFFRDLCILDLSSNFLSSTGNFSQSWIKLTRWFMRMPAPAGVIVALPLSELMGDDRGALHTLARRQRTLIEPLLRRFGNRLPLYVMVTQCDEFPGFSLWQQQLSFSQRQQPLGYSWNTTPHFDGQDENILQPLFSALKQGLSQTRLSMARPESLSTSDYVSLINFPESFSQLESSLRFLLAALCEPNAWFSHASLRSVWFTATEPNTENNGRRVSVFIQDLLTRHLPSLSLLHRELRWYQREIGKRACSVILGLCALWIVVSASQSYIYLQPNILQQPPDVLAKFLEKDEQYSKFSLRYLPFMPLLEQQHRRVESQLAKFPSNPRAVNQSLSEYQQEVLKAKPAQQRELILQLANAILTWKQMRNGATLNSLSSKPFVGHLLQQNVYPGSLSPLSILVLERYYMQHPDGVNWLQSAQKLLVRLVNNDPELKWLVAPANTLPALRGVTFWPSLSDKIELSGVWTRKGELATYEWMQSIELAVGHPLPILQQEKEYWPILRQDAWRGYLIDVAANLSSINPITIPRWQLIELGQNQSQMMQFVTSGLKDLNNIPSSQAQPWLAILRQLQQLAVNDNSSALLRRAVRADNRIRQSITDWLRGTPEKQIIDSTPPTELAWRKWQSARNEAVKEAVAQGSPSEYLTRGLSNIAQNSSEHNPLTDLFPAISLLQERISPRNNDASIAAVWSLYQYDAHRLLGNALAQSACWLNTQWKSSVIWPLNKDADLSSYEDQQALSQQVVSDFLRGPARSVLIANKLGPSALEFAGMKIPLKPDFIHLTQKSFSTELIQDVPQRASTRISDKLSELQAKLDAMKLQESAFEKQSWKINIASLPTTVINGAQVIPIGTKLTLKCFNGDQELISMNFAEKREFTWQPGQCSGVTLSIIFPDFTVFYQLKDDDAWPLFVNSFTSGEQLLDSDDFGDKAGLLHQLGIKQILVRFSVSDSTELETAWKSWNELENKINDINDRIIDLDTHANNQQLSPISALPSDIAQCQ